MARVQVYLPDDLHDELKAQALPASELFQRAVRGELRRRRLERAADEYLAELEAEVGEPSAADRAYADRVVGALAARPLRDAG